LSSEEWVISLITSPYPKKELKDSEENIKNQIERLHAEIVYYQSQLNNEKMFDKSYCTSMSSSVMQSLGFSPTKTLRYTNGLETFSPAQKEGFV
jgi:hypothetical protein